MKNLNENLNKGLNNFKNVLEKNKAVVIIQNNAKDKNKIEFVTDNISLFGYSPQDISNKNEFYSIFVHQEDIEWIKEKTRKKIKNKQTNFSLEYRVYTKNRKVRWVKDYSSIDYNNQGDILQVNTILFDISERKKKEEKLKGIQFRYGNILELMNEGVAISTKDEICKYVNNEFCNMLGYKKEEILGREFLDFLGYDSKKNIK